MAGGVLVCRPVDEAAVAEIRRRVSERRAPPTDLPHIYSGSIIANCLLCDREIYVGPKQQEALAKDPTIPKTCFLCLFDAMEAGVVPAGLRDLGNKEFG